MAMNVTANLGAIETAESFDVCIIGSGFAGTVLGKSLVERGVRTVILESGGGLTRWMLDKRLKDLAAYTVSGDADYPTERTKARALGGNSNFWTGRCERLHPSDLERQPYTPGDNPWPLTYEELDPYYERAEETLRVRGDSLSRYTPPRKKDLPVRARNDISSLKAMLAEVGVTVDDSPTATPKRALRFFRLPQELFSSFLSRPNALLVSGATVTRLLADEDRHIIGAQVQTLRGLTKAVRARYYVVASGGIETPRLLQLSRSSMFPEGIGNAYDRVGRGFTEHPGVNFYAKIRHNRHTIVPRHKVGRSHQFYDKFRCDGLGSVLPVFIQSWIFPHHLMRIKLSAVPSKAGAMLRRLVRPTLYIGATVEMVPHDGNRVTLGTRKDVFGNPLAHLHFSYTEEDRRTLDRTRQLIVEIFERFGAEDIEEAEVTWSRHHIGTCRMGDNPKTSVTDGNLRVHDCQNLFLCGSETFVTGGAVPPVLTIVALAHRLADHLVDRLRQV